MAFVNYDSELMTNYIEAVNVSAASHMSIVLHAANRQPVVFALSSHEKPRLQAIYVNQEGRRILVNIGAAVGVPADTQIQAFDVQQSDDSTVFLAFASKVDDRTSNLWIVKPFKFEEEITWQASPAKEVGQVYQIRIGPPPARGTAFPQLYLMHQPLNRTAKGSDLARVVVGSNQSILVHKDVSLPVNVQQIIDIAPAYGGLFGHGLVFLSELNGKRELHAKFGRPGDEPNDPLKWAEYKLQCPPGASSIETFVDPRDKAKRSSLMVACTQGIYLLEAKNIAAQTQGPGFMLATGKALTGARDLQIAQDGEDLSIWTTNEAKELTFSIFNLSKPAEVRTAPLLSSGSTTTFATLLSRPNEEGSLQNIIVANDDHGNLTLLEQSLDTGIWRQQPFYVESAGELRPIESYTISLDVFENEKSPLIQGQILLQSPSPQSITVNGTISSVDSVGTWFKTDLGGEIALIVPTNGATGQPLTVAKIRKSDGNEVQFTPFRIDPSQKIMDGMKKLASKEALDNAKTKDGKSLWEGVEKPDDKTLEQAAKCFSAINDAHATLPKDGSRIQVTEVAEASEPKSTGNIFMDAFNWVKRKIGEVTDWVIKKVGQVWQFVCDIGGKVMNFVLDCIEKVREAASWVWDKIKLGWNKLVEFIGFFFNWQDILDTKDTIKGLMNAGLDFAADGVEDFNDKIEGFFDNFIATIPGLTGNAKKRLQASKLNNSTQVKDKKAEEAKNSTQSKWVGERMKNGGSNTVAEAPKSGDAAVVDMWYQRVVPLIDSFKQLADDLGKDIAKLFQDSSMSQADLLNQLGSNLLVNVLNIVKNLIKALISVVAKLILVVKDFGNAKLSSGFLNTLYRWITRGSDLTLFDAVALLIAIPSTQIIKIVTGAKPPNLGTIDKNLFKAMIASKSSDGASSNQVQPASKQQIRDVNTVLLGCACGGALIKIVVDNIKFLYKTATQGLPVAVGSLSPGAIMEVFSMGVDAFAIYDAIMNPPEDGAPGAELIKIATYIKCFRLGANAIYMVAQKLGMENQAVDQGMLCVDLLTALANFGIYSAVYIEQLEATSWKEYDEAQTLTNGADNFLEAVAAIGYFTAFTFNKTEPMTTAVGLACLQIASYGAIVTKGANFRIEYEKS